MKDDFFSGIFLDPLHLDELANQLAELEGCED